MRRSRPITARGKSLRLRRFPSSTQGKARSLTGSSVQPRSASASRRHRALSLPVPPGPRGAPVPAAGRGPVPANTVFRSPRCSFPDPSALLSHHGRANRRADTSSRASPRRTGPCPPHRGAGGRGEGFGGAALRPPRRQSVSRAWWSRDAVVSAPMARSCRFPWPSASPGCRVVCTERDLDRYDCVVAVCRAGGEDLSAWMVSRGLALASRRYSTAYVGQDARQRPPDGDCGEASSSPLGTGAGASVSNPPPRPPAPWSVESRGTSAGAGRASNTCPAGSSTRARESTPRWGSGGCAARRRRGRRGGGGRSGECSFHRTRWSR